MVGAGGAGANAVSVMSENNSFERIAIRTWDYQVTRPSPIREFYLQSDKRLRTFGSSSEFENTVTAPSLVGHSLAVMLILGLVYVVRTFWTDRALV